MRARTKGRKRALDILYASDVRNVDIARELADAEQRLTESTDVAVSWLYARDVVEGVIEHGPEIDELIQTHSRDWPIERMPAVDRALLRIGVWEIVWNDEVPDAVAISEAVEAATLLSTEQSPGFINGLLAAVSRSKA